MGIIDTLRDAISFDRPKKQPIYGNGGLRDHLICMVEFDADPEEAFQCAEENFVWSLEVYYLILYLFVFKDRHSGNLILDTAGHVLHVTFGVNFGFSPGGLISLEMGIPDIPQLYLMMTHL